MQSHLDKTSPDVLRDSNPQSGVWLTKSEQVKFKSRYLAWPDSWGKQSGNGHEMGKVNHKALPTYFKVVKS